MAELNQLDTWLAELQASICLNKNFSNTLLQRPGQKAAQNVHEDQQHKNLWHNIAATKELSSVPSQHPQSCTCMNLHSQGGGTTRTAVRLKKLDTPTPVYNRANQVRNSDVWVARHELPLSHNRTVYCEQQVILQCGAHALHALLGRRVAQDPNYLFEHLNNTEAPPTDPGAPHNATSRHQRYGMYSVSAINHWLYEHTTSDAALAHIGSAVIRGPSQQEIMYEAPQGCKALLLHTGEGASAHFLVWIQSGHHWYECDSLTYNNQSQLVRQLTPQDWLVFRGCIYSLIKRDAYKYGYTLITHPRPQGSMQEHLRHGKMS
jgi:hypothetical protein